MILILILLPLIFAKEEKCYDPFIFHTFGNCPELQVRKSTKEHPNPPDIPDIDQLCPNEGTCKGEYFYTESKTEDNGEYYVTSGDSFQGECNCGFEEVEVFGKRCGDCLEFSIFNIWFSFCSDHVRVNDGIKTDITENYNFSSYEWLHIFIKRGMFNNSLMFTIIVNEKEIVQVKNLFLTTDENIISFYQGCTYFYGVYDMKLPSHVITSYSKAGINRKMGIPKECYQTKTISEIFYSDYIGSYRNLLWIFLVVLGILFILFVLWCIISVFYICIEQSKKQQ